MDGSIGADEDSMSPEPTVASMLGIKGPLRFRTHGSTQKAHVVLRQVELSDESGDEGDGKSPNKRSIYFSLFAQKRIEVKPGKEILLAVATPDGRFIESPVILTGDILDPKDLLKNEILSSSPLKEPIHVQQPATMPPKMRKTWTRRIESATPQPPPSPPPIYRSTGVQSETTTYTTTGVETYQVPTVVKKDTAMQTLVLPETIPSTASHQDASQQTVTPPTTQLTLESLHLVQSPPLKELGSLSPAEPTEVVFQERERSLSPMELSSAASSPVLPPTIPSRPISPIAEKKPESISRSPPGLFLSTSAATIDNVHISPMHLSPDNGDPPGLSLSFFPSPTDSTVSQTKPVDSQSSRSSESADNATTGRKTVPEDDGIDEPPPSGSYRGHSPQHSEETVPIPIPYKPKRKLVPNPFVSGGFVTDFVSVTPQKSLKSLPEETAKTFNSDSSDEREASELLLGSPPRDSRKSSPEGRSPQPSSASSSKVKVEDVATDIHQDIAVPSAMQAREPIALPQELLNPSHLASNTLNLPGRQIPRFSDPASIPPHSFRTQTSVQSTFVPSQSSQPPRQRSPPEPKSLAYISSGPYSNPLNIRPARNPQTQNFGQSQNTSLNLKPNHKKRLVVGNGWPYTRQSYPNNLKGGGSNGSPLNHIHPEAINTTNGDGLCAPMDGPYGRPQDMPPLFSPSPGQWAQPQANVSNQASEGQGSQRMSMSHTREDSEVDAYHPDQRFTFAQEPPRPPPSFQGPPQMPPFPPTQPPMIPPYHQPSFSPLPPPCPPAPAPSHTPTLPFQPPPPSNHAEYSSSVIRQIPPTPISAPTPHPLPPRPTSYTGNQSTEAWSPQRGIKRMGSPTPSPASVVHTNKASFSWPTVDPAFTVRIKGEDDPGIRTITFNSDGSHFAVACWDKSVRIWNHRTHTELAKLSHTMHVIAVAWMDHDSGVVTLGENGIVSTWTRNAQNKWQWAKILDARGGKQSEQKGSPSCLAFARDRIAISFLGIGVKVWLFIKGTWLPQRSILRQGVTTIKFVEDGDALIGGTGDGVLWRCEIPNGTLRALTFLKNKIFSLDVDARGGYVTVSLTGGRAQLVAIKQDEQRGVVEQTFAPQELELGENVSYDFGVAFANRHQNVLFGDIRGCVMVWDRNKAEVVSGFSHAEDDVVQAVSCFDGSQAAGGQIVTGTRNGHLSWFTVSSSDGQRKRAKVD